MHLPIGTLEELTGGTSIYTVCEVGVARTGPLWHIYPATPALAVSTRGLSDTRVQMGGGGKGPQHRPFSYLLADVGHHISWVAGGGGVIASIRGGYRSFKPCPEAILQKQHSLFVS